jgi:hypothetical protein
MSILRSPETPRTCLQSLLPTFRSTKSVVVRGDSAKLRAGDTAQGKEKVKPQDQIRREARGEFQIWNAVSTELNLLRYRKLRGASE